MQRGGCAAAAAGEQGAKVNGCQRLEEQDGEGGLRERQVEQRARLDGRSKMEREA